MFSAALLAIAFAPRAQDFPGYQTFSNTDVVSEGTPDDHSNIICYTTQCQADPAPPQEATNFSPSVMMQICDTVPGCGSVNSGAGSSCLKYFGNPSTGTGNTTYLSLTACGGGYNATTVTSASGRKYKRCSQSGDAFLVLRYKYQIPPPDCEHACSTDASCAGFQTDIATPLRHCSIIRGKRLS